MKYRLLFFLFIGLCSKSHIAFSQQDSDPCGCNGVLIDGVFNYRASQGDYQAKNDVLKYISNKDYETYKRDLAAGGGGSYAGFGINGNMSKSQYNQKQAENKSLIAGSTMVKNTQSLLESYGDNAVLQAWSGCKANCKNVGIHSWVEMLDANNMVLHLKWISNTASNAIVKNSTISGGAAVREGVPAGQILPNGTSITIAEQLIPIKRNNPNNPVIVNIQLSSADRDVAEYVPKYIQPYNSTSTNPIINITVNENGLNGSSTGYVTNKNPQYPGMITHDSGQPDDTVPDNAGWVVNSPKAGRYDLFVLYASDKTRPTNVLVNEDIKNPALVGRLSENTGGLNPENAKWNAEGTLNLPQGPVKINFIRLPAGNIPHIMGFRLSLQKQN